MTDSLLNRTPWRRIPLLACLALLQTVPVTAGEEPAVSETSSNGHLEPAPADPTAEQLKRLSNQMTAQQQQISTLTERAARNETENRSLTDEINSLREEQSDLALSFAEYSTAQSQQRFRVFGFMDTSFTMAFPQNYTDAPDWSNPVFALTPRKSSFHMTNVNLYFKSEMTDTLETLIETRFTFHPNGQVVSYPTETFLVDDQGQTRAVLHMGEWNRTDTTTRETYDGSFRLGGVAIERAHLDWKPSDRFNFRAGRYLTPYGIWNEDHGATVFISSTIPLMVRSQYVPAAQTGFMIFGRGFPSSWLDLEYALTVSNGRGPTTEVYDLDRNKALGLRGKVNFRAGELRGTLGAYGYYGKYTDTRDTMQVYLNETGTGFADMKNPIRYTENIVRQYKEWILATDLRLSFRGFELLGEYVRGKIEFLQPSEVNPIDPLLQGVSTTIPTSEANYIKQGAYFLAAYELPLQKYLRQTRIKPFAGLDILVPNDAYDARNIAMLQFGLNIKPSPFVALKSNAYYVIPIADTPIASPVWYWAQQLAVSF